MTTQHTPGPWFVRQRKHVIEIDNGLERPDYRHITNALPSIEHGKPSDEHGVSLQVLADARLIAAAPYLLQQLKQIATGPWSAQSMREIAEYAITEVEGEICK